MILDTAEQRDLLFQIVANAPIQAPIGRLPEVSHDMTALLSAIEDAEIATSPSLVPDDLDQAPEAK